MNHEDIKLIKEIGSGVHGSVYSGILMREKPVAAVKRLGKAGNAALVDMMKEARLPVTKIGYSADTDKKIMETRQQLNEVMDVMRSNIERMALRADRLEDLACRAEVLDLSASTFHRSASEVRRKNFWKKNMFKFIAAGVVFVCGVSGVAVVFF